MLKTSPGREWDCRDADAPRLTVTTTSGSVESPIGEGDEFYLENLAPGRMTLVQYGDMSCAFTLNMPTAAPAVALGTRQLDVPAGALNGGSDALNYNVYRDAARTTVALFSHTLIPTM